MANSEIPQPGPEPDAPDPARAQRPQPEAGAKAPGAKAPRAPGAKPAQGAQGAQRPAGSPRPAQGGKAAPRPAQQRKAPPPQTQAQLQNRAQEPAAAAAAAAGAPAKAKAKAKAPTAEKGATPAAAAAAAGTAAAKDQAVGADGAPAQSQGSGRGVPGDRRPAASRLSWALAAVVCAAAGITASLLGAGNVASEHKTQAMQSFQTSAVSTAATLKLMLQHEEDLATSGGTYFANNPKASQSQFAAWAHWARTLRRYPELERIGFVTLVSPPAAAAQGSAGTRNTSTAPVSGAGSRSAAAPASHATAPNPLAGLRVTPPGIRPYYCLTSTELVRAPAHQARAGIDYCAQMPALIFSRQTGADLVAPVSAKRPGQLAIETPVYRGSAPPASTAGKIGAFAGWLREVLEPGLLLETTLVTHPGEAIVLAYAHGATRATFTIGTPHSGAPSRTTILHEGWTVTTFGEPINSGLISDREARGLLIAGSALSILIGLLIYALGTARPATTDAPEAAPKPRQKARSVKDEDLYDELTGLPNKALTLDRAERTVARAGRQSGMLAGALLVDVDWFDDVNQKLGRAAGDQLLKTVAERLEQVVRTEDSVGRLEGDKFLITVESVARGARLDSLARRLIEALHKPVDLDDFGPSFVLTASIGVAYGRYTSHEQLIHDARLAMEASKQAGKDRYTLFNANMRAVIEDRGVLEAELNAALREGQFFLLYQPICDLRTRKVVGLEATIRWRHPKQGVQLPADFLPLAEETGLIVPIGRWVLQEACARAAEWEVAGQKVPVGVQVSARQFNREGFATDVLRALQQSGVDPSMLTLEIAETIVMADATAATERMHQLKNLGVSMAIDDFGSGYAYRADLQRMPLDFLKVDRSELAASEDEDYRHWLLEAILVFGRDLSLTVIAKGIETAEQVSALQQMGCELAQGHFFGEPTPADALERLFADGVPGVRATSTGLVD
jgi:diguanylate cyclase (GGDEF)-like protein